MDTKLNHLHCPLRIGMGGNWVVVKRKDLLVRFSKHDLSLIMIYKPKDGFTCWSKDGSTCVANGKRDATCQLEPQPTVLFTNLGGVTYAPTPHVVLDREGKHMLVRYSRSPAYVGNFIGLFSIERKFGAYHVKELQSVDWRSASGENAIRVMHFQVGESPSFFFSSKAGRLFRGRVTHQNQKNNAGYHEFLRIDSNPDEYQILTSVVGDLENRGKFLDNFEPIGNDDEYILGVNARMILFLKRSKCRKVFRYTRFGHIDYNLIGFNKVRSIYALQSTRLLSHIRVDQNPGSQAPNRNEGEKGIRDVCFITSCYDSSKPEGMKLYSNIFHVQLNEREKDDIKKIKVVRSFTLPGQLASVSEDERTLIMAEQHDVHFKKYYMYETNKRLEEPVLLCAPHKSDQIQIFNDTNFIVARKTGIYICSQLPTKDVCKAVMASAGFDHSKNYKLAKLLPCEIKEQLEHVKVESDGTCKLLSAIEDDGTAEVKVKKEEYEMFRNHVYLLYNCYVQGVVRRKMASHFETGKILREKLTKHIQERAAEHCNFRSDERGHRETTLVLNAEAFTDSLFSEFHMKQHLKFSKCLEHLESFKEDAIDSNFSELLKLKEALDSGIDDPLAALESKNSPQPASFAQGSDSKVVPLDDDLDDSD